MSSEDDTRKSEFLFAKVIPNPRDRPKPRGGFSSPEYDEVDFDNENLSDREQQGVENQLRETTKILSSKSLRNENEIFYELYTKAKTSEYEVSDLLQRLKASVVAYLDRKRNGILVVGSNEKLQQLSNKKTPKYLTNKVRIIKPLLKQDQVEESITTMTGVKMLIFSIIPNLDTISNKIYIEILKKFFDGNQIHTYGEEFQKFGFILADVTSSIVKELIEKSTFIFKINLIPEGIAQQIRETDGDTSPNSSTQNPPNIANPYLPTVVLMDSGVNQIPKLNSIILSRNSYNFVNLDDGHVDHGHGTPIAHLIAYGENNEPPIANIISYKIWASNERTFASRGLIRGIEEYCDQTRFFVTSIGIPDMPNHLLVTLDKLIQSKNVCLVASAGNLEFPELQSCLVNGGQYPQYLRRFPVMSPANGVNIVAVGSYAIKTSNRFQSIADAKQISPHSRCGAGEYNLFECKKPQVVEHGGNINIVDRDFNLNDEGVGVDTISRLGTPISMSGTSFSSPLFVRRLVRIQRVYRDSISNIETLLAISYLSCENNFEGCSGYGAPMDFTHSDYDDAVYLAEGTIGFTQVVDNTITTPINDIIIYVPPKVHEIKFCLAHSDDFHKAVIPTLETFFEIKTTKTGSDSQVYPINRNDISNKTNVKILTYKFDQRSMEGWWTFSIIPRTTNGIIREDKRKIHVRFGCAILLKGESDRRSNKSLTMEINENRERYSA